VALSRCRPGWSSLEFPMPGNDLDQAIRDNAAGPARVQGDSGSVQQHSLKDQIEADRYLASKDAAKRPARALRLTRLIPPGAEGG
jgi:hypothetical protein